MSTTQRLSEALKSITVVSGGYDLDSDYTVSSNEEDYVVFHPSSNSLPNYPLLWHSDLLHSNIFFCCKLWYDAIEIY